MKDNKALLVRDTLSFLRQEGLVHQASLRKTTPLKAPKPLPKPLPKPVTQKTPTPIINQSAASKADQKPKVPTETPLLTDAIKRHLPHLRIIEKIPLMQQAIIIFDDKDELLFLEGVKKAIENRFCPCLLTLDDSLDFSSFICVITTKDRGLKDQILIESSMIYRENPDKKRILWSQICQHLSPKFS